MKFNEKCIWMVGEILIQNGWLRWDQLESALSVQRENGQLLGEILVENQVVSRRNLFRALAFQSGIPYVDLKSLTPQPEALHLVPRRLAYEYHILPLAVRDEILLVAIANPLDMRPMSDLQAITRLRDIRPVLACPEDLEQVIPHYYGIEGLAA